MYIDMKVLFTICGRAGSKGIKGKNIRDFCGKPLALYTLSAIDLYCARHEENCCDVAVNTDSERLREIITGSAIGNNRPICLIERTVELADDRVAKVSVLLATLQEMEKRSGKSYDIVVDLDITSPLRTVANVENLIEKKLETGADVVFSVTEARRNPYYNMVRKTEHGYKQVIESNFVSRQQAPLLYDMNASLYAYEPDFLRSGKNVLDGYGEIIEMMDTGILDLDKPSDFELMEIIAEALFEKNSAYKEIRENIK